MLFFFPPSWWWRWWLKALEPEPQPGMPAPVPAPSPGIRVFRWFHRDDNLANVTRAALDTALRGAWMELDEAKRRRQFRAFVLLSLRVAPLSSRDVTLGELGPHLYSSQERNAAGSAIARTLVLLVPGSVHARSDVVTEAALPATGVVETGLAPALVVVLVTLCALAAAYLGSVGIEGIHAVNFNNEVTKRMLATQARALEVLSLHVERERIAGRELPFDESERALLYALEDTQRSLATLQRKPLPTPFQGATEFVRSSAQSILPMAGILLLAMYFLNQPQQRRS